MAKKERKKEDIQEVSEVNECPEWMNEYFIQHSEQMTFWAVLETKQVFEESKYDTAFNYAREFGYTLQKFERYKWTQK